MAPYFAGLITVKGLVMGEGHHTVVEIKNRLVQQAEQGGFDWFFSMDSDEAMFPEDLAKMHEAMKTETLLVQTRYNFIGDMGHYDVLCGEDWQARVFKLGMGYHWAGHPYHATVFRGQEPTNWYDQKAGLWRKDWPIYHYGLIQKAERDRRFWRSGERYEPVDFPGTHPIPANVV